MEKNGCGRGGISCYRQRLPLDFDHKPGQPNIYVWRGNTVKTSSITYRCRCIIELHKLSLSPNLPEIEIELCILSLLETATSSQCLYFSTANFC